MSLVDFDNDCVGTSLAVARALGPRLSGVRLDTSETMVDRSVVPLMGGFDPRGVNPQLVRAVRSALDAEGFQHVEITVSGGFDPDKIRRFEAEGVPVDSYGVGSSLFAGRFDFTADIVDGGRPAVGQARAVVPSQSSARTGRIAGGTARRMPRVTYRTPGKQIHPAVVNLSSTLCFPVHAE